jgi:glycosylphosphatidylinositol transamidase (GPIT) subunit GPI8
MKSDYLQDLKWIKNELRNLLPKQRFDNLDKAIECINEEISEELEALKAVDEQDSEDEEQCRKRHE